MSLFWHFLTKLTKESIWIRVVSKSYDKTRIIDKTRVIKPGFSQNWQICQTPTVSGISFAVLSITGFTENSGFYRKQWFIPCFIPLKPNGSESRCFHRFFMLIRVYSPVGERVFSPFLVKTRKISKITENTEFHGFHGFYSVSQKWHFFPVLMGTCSRNDKTSFDDSVVVLVFSVFLRGGLKRVLVIFGDF